MHAKTSSRAAEQLDDFDRILLGRLQQHIPLIDRPFSAIAAELESDEERVLNRARALTGEGLIRETSGIFDSARLGYRSTLVAARYAEERLVEAAALVSSHPGVSHNYRRDHAFNLWYTLAVPPGTSLEASVDELHLQTGAQTTLLLPALRTFKLGVQLDLVSGRQRGTAVAPRPSVDDETPHDVSPPTATEIQAVRALQRQLPLVPRPFDVLAQSEGFGSGEALLDEARRLHQRGGLRRLASVLRHRRAGFSANAMVAWRVPAEDAATIGPIMAEHEMVSHCYERLTYPEWPFRLFTMLHARERAVIDDAISEIEAASGCTDHVTIYSTEEFKKARVRYFVD